MRYSFKNSADSYITFCFMRSSIRKAWPLYLSAHVPLSACCSMCSDWSRCLCTILLLSVRCSDIPVSAPPTHDVLVPILFLWSLPLSSAPFGAYFTTVFLRWRVVGAVGGYKEKQQHFCYCSSPFYSAACVRSLLSAALFGCNFSIGKILAIIAFTQFVLYPYLAEFWFIFNSRYFHKMLYQCLLFAALVAPVCRFSMFVKNLTDSKWYPDN